MLHRLPLLDELYMCCTNLTNPLPPTNNIAPNCNKLFIFVVSTINVNALTITIIIDIHIKATDSITVPLTRFFFFTTPLLFKY